jgi:hypothetical protein
MPGSLPSVEGTSKALLPRFRELFGREFVDLSAGGDGDGTQGDVEELRETVGRAEEEAGRMNEAAGGWSREPDLSKRVI